MIAEVSAKITSGLRSHDDSQSRKTFSKVMSPSDFYQVNNVGSFGTTATKKNELPVTASMIKEDE